jgi:RNA polymerase sigma-70 factor, ECF subfamily
VKSKSPRPSLVKAEATLPGAALIGHAMNTTEYTALVLPLQEALYGQAVTLTRDPSAAEDLVQEALLRAYKSRSTFKRGSNIKAWLSTILRNTFINEYHRRMRRREVEASVDAQMRSIGLSVAVGCPGYKPDEPEDVVQHKVTSAEVQRALSQIPPKYAQAVTLVDLHGLSYAAVANRLGVPKGTVMSRVHRGREKLHGLLAAHAHALGMSGTEAPRSTPYTRRKVAA